MNVTLPLNSTRNGANYSNKQMTAVYIVAVVENGEIIFPVKAKCYMSRHSGSSTVWATLYAITPYSDPRVFNGHGVATGGGYHHSSEAIARAIESAGIELDTDIGGRGESAINNALKAITKAMGYTGLMSIVEA